MIRTCEVPP